MILRMAVITNEIGTPTKSNTIVCGAESTKRYRTPPPAPPATRTQLPNRHQPPTPPIRVHARPTSGAGPAVLDACIGGTNVPGIVGTRPDAHGSGSGGGGAAEDGVENPKLNGWGGQSCIRSASAAGAENTANSAAGSAKHKGGRWGGWKARKARSEGGGKKKAVRFSGKVLNLKTGTRIGSLAAGGRAGLMRKGTMRRQRPTGDPVGRWNKLKNVVHVPVVLKLFKKSETFESLAEGLQRRSVSTMLNVPCIFSLRPPRTLAGSTRTLHQADLTTSALHRPHASTADTHINTGRLKKAPTKPVRLQMASTSIPTWLPECARGYRLPTLATVGRIVVYPTHLPCVLTCAQYR